MTPSVPPRRGSSLSDDGYYILVQREAGAMHPSDAAIWYGDSAVASASANYEDYAQVLADEFQDCIEYMRD